MTRAVYDADGTYATSVANVRANDLIAVRLTPAVKMIAVASPDYPARHGTPRTPADLHQHACINWRLQADGRVYRWQFEKRGKPLELAVHGPLTTNQAHTGLAAALRGLDAPALAAKIFGAGVVCTIGSDHDTAAALTQMGAEHHECEVSEIIEDSQRKLVTTPAYMLAQSIAEAASGINKLVDRVLELAHH